jgi:hypothetical protein
VESVAKIQLPGMWNDIFRRAIILRVLSLFAGLGGWESQFPRSWTVLTHDINSDLNAERQVLNLDVLDYYNDMSSRISAHALAVEASEAIRGHTFDLIIASPPCYEFYKHEFPERWNHADGDESIEMSTACLANTLTLIYDLQPKFWLIENSRSGVRHVTEYFGRCRQHIGAWYLWHNMPLLSANVPKKFEDDRRRHPLRSNYNAIIPESLSLAVVQAMVEQQRIIEPQFPQWPPL